MHVVKEGMGRWLIHPLTNYYRIAMMMMML